MGEEENYFEFETYIGYEEPMTIGCVYKNGSYFLPHPDDSKNTIIMEANCIEDIVYKWENMRTKIVSGG